MRVSLLLELQMVLRLEWIYVFFLFIFIELENEDGEIVLEQSKSPIFVRFSTRLITFLEQVATQFNIGDTSRYTIVVDLTFRNSE